MDKNMTVSVANRASHKVGYSVPELGVVSRQFMPRQTKEITFNELEQLSYLPGGKILIKEYLVVRSPEALEALGLRVEPEYFYTEEDIKRLLQTGSLNEFLDCLDFAPLGVLELVKKMAVDLPLNDMSKRDAILEKLDFDVTNAIRIKNTKFDGGDADNKESETSNGRRAAVPAPSGAPETVRRVATPNYKVTNIKE